VESLQTGCGVCKDTGAGARTGEYPRGLKGAAIPLGARIVGVADTFEMFISDFSAAGCATVLTPGQSCALIVTFTPSGTGTRSALISIRGADGGNPPAVNLAVSLSGIGR
jgi:hypothetical protein